jgi:hypothetical protein
MKIEEDKALYLQFCESFISDLTFATARTLKENNIPDDKIGEISKSILFDVAALFDGSWELDHGDKRLEPKLLFQLEGNAERLIWDSRGTHMHELMHDWADNGLAEFKQMLNQTPPD